MTQGTRRGRIFVSYRRDDTSGIAGRLSDRLDTHFGHSTVFMDVDSVPPGGDFVKAIDDAVGSCSVLLAIVGSEWLTIADELGRRRIDLPGDFVALEIGAGLARGIPVIPVLVDGAASPRESDGLPPSLAELPHRQAVRVDHEQFSIDAANLIRVIETVLPADDPPAPALGRRPLTIAAATALAAAIVAVGLFALPTGGSREGPAASASPEPSVVTPTPGPTRPDAVFSDDFTSGWLDPLKWRPVANAGVIQQAEGHLRLFVRPGPGVDYAKLEPLPLSRPFTDVRFDVTMPTFGRGYSGGASFVINPRGPQPQIMTFSAGDAGGAVAYPLTCDRPQCRIATYADFTESTYHYPKPPQPGDTLSIEIVRKEGHLDFLVNGALAGATKNDTGPLSDFWFAVSADAQESWDLLIDNLIVR